MTLILETTPEIEAEIERFARESGQSVPEFVLEAVRERAKRDKEKLERAKIWESLTGSMPQLTPTDELMAEKHAENEREEARFDARL